MLTIQNFLDAFTYPFKDPDGIKKVLVGFLLTSISSGIEFFAITFLVGELPLLSLVTWTFAMLVILHVDGFNYWLYQDLLKNPDDHELPVWDDWRDMFYTGFRLRLIEFIFMLPIQACMIYILFGPFRDMVNAFQTSAEPFSSIPDWTKLATLILSIIIPSLLSTIFSLIGLIFQPPMVTNMVANDSLKAAFHLRKIWHILKNNPWNFILPGLLMQVFLVFSNFMLFTFFGTCFMLGVILLSGFFYFYRRLVITNLYSRAYTLNINELSVHPAGGASHA
jgi:hypothetical protein